MQTFKAVSTFKRYIFQKQRRIGKNLYEQKCEIKSPFKDEKFLLKFRVHIRSQILSKFMEGKKLHLNDICSCYVKRKVIPLRREEKVKREK